MVTVVFEVVLACAFCTGASGQPWDGNGVEGDPYLIWDACDMQAIGADSNYWDSHFKLMADINLAAYDGNSFNIIGTSASNPFTGVFDGNGHTISNFSYDSNGAGRIGLFGCVDDANAEIKRLFVTDPNVDAWDGSNVAVLVGFLLNGIISQCHIVGGQVQGGDFVGALLGQGQESYGYRKVSDCSATTTVSGNEHVGGLVGSIVSVKGDASIENSWASGYVSGMICVGGLAGHAACEVLNCFAVGDVNGLTEVGGLLGQSGDPYSFYTKNCYAGGHVKGTSEVGGLVGSSLGDDVVFSYWDVNTSGQLTSAGGKGKTTAEMKDPNTYIGWGGCGNEGVWMINDGNDYPRLWWENKPGVPLSGQLSDFIMGSGTEADPYLIYTAEELNMIGLFMCEWGANFRLAANIDLSGYTGTSFNVIGNDVNAFTGVFDGNGHTISNFTYVDHSQYYSMGLFGYVDGANAEIRDLILTNTDVNAGMGEWVGSLVGNLGDGTVAGCYASGSVSGYRSVGGLVGWSDGTISNCYATGSVSGSRYVGGLVGWSDGTISNCYATGSVTGTSWEVGGLVGHNYGTISNSYATGSVTGDDKVGGLAGYNYATISNSYATGSVTGDFYVGGLVGMNYDIVSNCYATGSVTGDIRVGGLVGHDNVGNYTSCFWDSNVNPDVNGIGNRTDPNVTGLPTVLMQTESTYTDAGWDFVGEVINGPNDIWDICEGTNYPKFVWSIPEADFVCPDGVDFIDYGFFADHWLETDYGDVNGVELTGDGKINWEDFGLFAGWWMVSECGGCGGADFTGDGNVDYLDLDVFAGYWLKSEYGDCGRAELTGDGAVGFDDLARFSASWLAGL